MQATVNPGFLKGMVSVPASKSMMQRACAGALLHKGTTIINNPGSAEDDKAALGIIQQLGATIVEHTSTRLIIASTGTIGNADTINCGESGLSARLFTPIAALSGSLVKVEGYGSLTGRPMTEFSTILPALGVSLDGFTGYLPFTLREPVQPKSLNIDGSVSSQFLTGVLFALSASATEPLVVTVNELKSKPYIDLTLDVLKQFGKSIEHENYERFFIDPSTFSPKDEVVMDIEADWSGTAFWLAGAAINGEVSIPNLSISSHQADQKILDALKLAGANIANEAGVVKMKESLLNGFSFDATDSPDLFPILSVLAACCEGESRIAGLHRLKHKESDRQKSILDMLAQFGVLHAVANDELHITGQAALNACTINGHNDHRIVMAAAIASLRADGPVTITDAQAVAKSYPDFFHHLSSLGIQCFLKD